MNLSYPIVNNSFEIDNTTHSSINSELIAMITDANVLLAMFMTAFFVILLLDFIHRKRNLKL